MTFEWSNLNLQKGHSFRFNIVKVFKEINTLLTFKLPLVKFQCVKG